MIIINLTGGLGNQMFQYAFGRYLSIKHKTELKYHFTNALFNTQRNFSLDIFNIQATKATNEDLKAFGIVKNIYLNRILYLLDERYKVQFNKYIVTQRPPYSFSKTYLITPNNRYIQGYFTDERYFYRIEKTLRNDFTLNESLDENNKRILAEMKVKNSVSIHVRRGDYITNKANAVALGFIGLEYYENSIKRMNDLVSNPVYYVFSDDLTWCKENIGKLTQNIHYIDLNKDSNVYKDLVLMGGCKHNIVANSTFSWWGNWLNSNHDKITIKP